MMTKVTVKNSPMPPNITGYGYVRPLGSGGFADVYQYEQNMPRRMVAVKVLKTPVVEARDRSDFEAEADAMARLSSHPSIVSVYSAGVAADGRPYLTMEYCPESMRARTKANPAPLQEVLDAGVRLAGALESAHRSGILHRDIKPSNVLLTTTGRPALTDFGIAMLRGRTVSEEAKQALSIPWSAPEVITAKTSGDVASEIWSLGATLYTFAAGVSPFESPDRSQNTKTKISARISAAKYTPIAGAQAYEAFDAVLRRCMHLRPDRRYENMLELAEALRQLQRGYGFDVTAIELVESNQTVVSVLAAQAVRGPTVTSVRAHTRAQRRAQLRVQHLPEDRDGVLVDRPRSVVKPALVGAAIAAAIICGALGVLATLGMLW